MPLFGYDIIPRGQRMGQSLIMGNLFITDFESAKRYVQTVTVHDLQGQSDLEVILRDMQGKELWRGPYLGNGSNA